MKDLLILLFLALFIFTIPAYGQNHEGHDHSSHAEHGDRKEEVKHQDDKHPEHEDHGDGEQAQFVELSSEAAKKAGIKIVKVERSAFNEILSFPGEIAVNGDNLVHVAPRFEGTIKKVLKQVGQSVQIGDILATVQSNQSLASYNIEAESTGVVIDKDASAGEFITNSKSIFTIANFDTVWVNVAINVKDLTSIKKDYEATISSKSINLSQKAKINYIRPTLSETTRTALARIVLDNKEKKWFPGMFVNVTVMLPSSEKALVIPSSSVVFIDNEYKVFVKSKLPDGDSGFQAVDVEVGRDNTEYAEILNGLKAGQEIASGKTFILKAELGKGSAGHDH